MNLKTEIHLPNIIGRGYASFWSTKKRYRVLKGGRASKKSTTTAIWFVYNIMKHSKANALVVRKTFNTHKDSTYAQLKWAASILGVTEYWRFTLSPLEAVYTPTGQKIIFRGFDDPLKLTSMTVNVGKLCWVWLEEAYEIDNEADFDTLDESIRGEMPDGLWKQITITFNPWVNSHWTKSRFFDKEFPDSFTSTTTYKCNEWLDAGDRKRIEDLEFTNPDRYKVVALGEYGIPGGTYFEEFRTDVHVVEPFVIPPHWQRFRFLDYGLDMLAHYWAAIDMEGNAFVYKELYESDLIISEAAKRINELTIEKVKFTYAPPDLWNRRQETGKSAADLYRENGVMLTKAGNDRVQGWLNVKEWLKPYKVRDEQTGEEVTTARLKIFRNCVNLIRTLPQLQSDEKDPNDVATEPHEITHAPDALRYFCGMRTKPSILPVVKDDFNPTPQEKQQKAIKALTGGRVNTKVYTRW